MQYILDTNVIRSAPTRRLAHAAANGHRPLVSPMSVWELLSHFDDGDTAFERCRGWMRKLEHCHILEHPDAEIREALGVAKYIPEPDRIAWREREGAMAIVAIFASASSPADVHRGRFLDAEGKLHTTQDCGRLVADVLADLERKHATLLRSLVVAYKAELARVERKRAELRDEEFFSHIMREVQRIAATADTPTIEAPAERIFELMFPSLGHALETAFRCIATGAQLDPNDYEDAVLCQHVDLASNRVLVTSDGKTLDALSKAHARLTRHARYHEVFARPDPLAVGQSVFEAFVDGLE